MTRIVFTAVIVAWSTIATSAGEDVVLPKDVPPICGTALATSDDGKWSIALTIPRVRWKLVGEKRPKVEWPNLEVTAEGASLTLSMAYDSATQLREIAQNRILDLQGKRLSREEALKRLGSRTPVLISVSGRMPDAYYLQTTKPDTLIVVLGIPSAPAPDLLPQPVSSSNED